VADRFLIVRLGALGDIVHAIPVAAAIRRAFSSAAHRLAGQREASGRARFGSGNRSAAGR
jgi:ADP-heptose:LPS heptosyltransferase